MNTNETTWKTNDPAWLKERRVAWKAIEEKLKSPAFSFLQVWERSKLKSYYLKGYPSPQGVKRTSDYPLRGVDSPALFEFWLSPDHSDASLEQIFGRIPDIYEKENIRERFRNVVIDYFPEEGSLFDGFEAKLYNSGSKISISIRASRSSILCWTFG